MKKYLIIASIFLSLIFCLSTLPVWAKDNDLENIFKVEHLINEETIYFHQVDNRYYVTYEKDYISLHSQHFDMTLPKPALAKITSPISMLYITDQFSGKLLFSAKTNYIVIDSQDYFYGAIVTIHTNEGSYVWDHTKNSIIYMYFEGEIDYRPSIEGNELFITNIDEPISVIDIKGYLKAFDDIDGDLTDEIFIYEDNYTRNSNRLGEYEIIYGVKDSSNNIAYLTVNILVVDLSPPEIIGNLHDVEISYDNNFDVDDFISKLEIEDNYDKDILLETYINTYSGNENKIGTYQIGLRATDSSGNINEVIKNIIVVDKVPPIIIGQEIIEKSINEEVLLNDIINLFSAYDDYDGDLSSKIKVIEDNYSNNMFKIGKYQVTLEVVDSSNNKTSHIILINVLDTQKPIFYINKDVKITTPLNYELSSDRLEKILKNHDAFSGKLIEIINTEYNNYNSSKEGLYKISIDYLDKENKIQKANILINVYDQNNISPVDRVVNSNSNFWYLLIFPIGIILSVSAYIIIKKQKNKR